MYAVDPNYRDSEGLTPLHYAARCKKERSRQRSETHLDDDEDEEEAAPPEVDEAGEELHSVVSFLVQNRADPNAQDIYGQTPLHYAAMRGNDSVAKELMSFKVVDIEVGMSESDLRH